MGQGAVLRIYNATSHDLNKKENPKPYQMNAFNPPTKIATKTAEQFYIEFNEQFGKTQSDDNGEVRYSINHTPVTMFVMAHGNYSDSKNPHVPFTLDFKFSWPDTWSPKTQLPYYLYYIKYTDFDETFSVKEFEEKDFFKSNEELIQIPVNNGVDDKYQLYKLIIVELAYICGSNDEAVKIATTILNEQKDSPKYKEFFAKLEKQLKTYPIHG